METNFLDLPAELRIEIYNYAFATIDKQVIPIIRQRRNRLHKYLRPILQRAGKESRCPSLALLQTCRQVYQEASSVVYENCHVGLWLSDSPGQRMKYAEMVRGVALFAETFEGHLSFVQYLDLGLRDLIRFLPGTEGEGAMTSEIAYNQRKATRSLTKLMDHNKSGHSYMTTADEKFLLRLLGPLTKHLPSVRSVTYHQTRAGSFMISARLKEVLEGLFPNLEEVCVLNKIGSELEMDSMKTISDGLQRQG